MSGRSFSLQPFPVAGHPPRVTIVGSIARRSNTLAIRYALLGRLADLVIPAPAAVPARRYGLWEETCFESFLGPKDSPRYWECNLSPSGDWNVYAFTAYRQGMEEELALTLLSFKVQRKSDSLSLALKLDLDAIVRADQALEVAVSAVIKQRNGEVTYWALTHRGPQADFHCRDSFIIAL
jgi:hypothetical protein